MEIFNRSIDAKNDAYSSPKNSRHVYPYFGTQAGGEWASKLVIRPTVDEDCMGQATVGLLQDLNGRDSDKVAS